MRWQLESLMTAARVSCNGSTTFSWTSFFNLRCQGDESLLGCWLLQDVGAGLSRRRKRHAHSVATTAGWAAGASKATARRTLAPELLSLLSFLFSPFCRSERTLEDQDEDSFSIFPPGTKMPPGLSASPAHLGSYPALPAPAPGPGRPLAQEWTHLPIPQSCLLFSPVYFLAKLSTLTILV